VADDLTEPVLETRDLALRGKQAPVSAYGLAEVPGGRSAQRGIRW
jgi:hypothetical protein